MVLRLYVDDPAGCSKITSVINKPLKSVAARRYFTTPSVLGDFWQLESS